MTSDMGQAISCVTWDIGADITADTSLAATMATGTEERDQLKIKTATDNRQVGASMSSRVCPLRLQAMALPHLLGGMFIISILSHVSLAESTNCMARIVNPTSAKFFPTV